MIELNNLSFKYSDKLILNKISYTFENSKIYGIIGRNGAGKTTLFECINGQLKTNDGLLKINSLDYTNKQYLENPLLIINNEKIFYKNLTVKEHLNLLTTFDNISVNEILNRFNLVDYQDYLPKELSLGTSQRLNIAIRLAINNNDILADEPFNGLDPVELNSMQQQFINLRKNDRTIIISSHDIHSLLSICDILLYLKDGQLNVINVEDENEIAKIHQLLQ